MNRRYLVGFFVLLSLAAFASTTAGQEWIQLQPAGTPPTPRSQLNAVYDAASNRLILIGGVKADWSDPNSFLNDAWVLTNANGLGGTPQWIQLDPSGMPPPPRSQHTVVYDPGSNRLILFGGHFSPITPNFNDVWILTNANGIGSLPAWEHPTVSGDPPPPRGSHTAVCDPVRNTMIVFGGATLGCCDLGDAWVLTNANGLGGTPTWTELHPVGTIPTRRRYQMAVYDPASNRMTVFAGLLTDPEVWLLENANGLGGTPQWTFVTPGGTAPPSLSEPKGGLDLSSNRMVAWGGLINPGGPWTSNTWVLIHASEPNSPQWSRLVPANEPPPPRANPAVYDEISNRLMVFGGLGDTSGFLNDVWVLTNANGITNVAIDIKPGSFPNSINLGAEGVVPVAVLTTPESDASTVDGLSLALSGASVKLRGKSQEVGALEDVDDDGDLDLVVQFYINELELTEGVTEAVLTGKTKAGAEIIGKDSVRVVQE